MVSNFPSLIFVRCFEGFLARRPYSFLLPALSALHMGQAKHSGKAWQNSGGMCQEHDLLLCFCSVHLVKGSHLLAGPHGLRAMSWVELYHHLEAIAED